MIEDLGSRMKSQYEDRYRLFIPRRTYTILRLDGKSFHTYTKSMVKPFDSILSETMDNTAVRLCENIQGAQFAYVQSDEISILLTDFDSIQTQAWFDGNIQKMTSVSASFATGFFNSNIQQLKDISDVAFFDSRVFIIPDPTEVENYFIWRQRDAVRNSIQMLARSIFSHRKCENKSNSDLQEMCFQEGKNWNDVDPRFKRGGFIRKQRYIKEDNSVRTKWVTEPSFDFLKERDKLTESIPVIS